MEQLSADGSSQECAVSPSLNQTEDNIHAQMDTGVTAGPGVFGESLSDPKSNISPPLTCTSHPRTCFEEQKQEPEPSKSTVSIKDRIMVELSSEELSNMFLLSNKPCVSDKKGSYQSEEGKSLKRKCSAQAQGFSVPDPYCKIGAIDPSCDGTESAHGDGTSLSHLLQYREEECCGKRDDERIDNQSVVKCDTCARVWPESDKKSVCIEYVSSEHTADSSDSPVAHAFLQLDTDKKNQTKACISSSVCLASSENPLQAQVIPCKENCREKPVHIYKDNPPLPACILSSMIQEDVELKKRHQNEEIPNSGSVSPVVVPLMTVMSIEPCTVEKEPQDKAIGERIAYMSKQAEDLDLCSAVGKSIEKKRMQMEPSVPCEQAVMHMESNGDEKKLTVSLNQVECRGNRVSNELLGVCHPSNDKEDLPSRENVSSVVMREARCGSGSPPPLQLVQCREDATANVLLKKDTNETAERKVEVEQNNHNGVYYSVANETDELCRVNKEPQIVNVFSLSPSINLHSLDKTSGSTESIGSENICVGSTEDKCVGGQEGLIEAKKMMDTATQVCVLSQDSSTKCVQISETVTCPHDIADPLHTISTGEYHLVPASVQDSSSPEPNALSHLHNDMEKHNRSSLKRCFHDTGNKLSSKKEVPTKKCRRWHEESQETSGIGVHGASIGNILQQFITEHQTVRQADKREGTACTHNQHLIAQIIHDFFNSLETVSLAQGHSFSLKHTEIPIETQSVNVTHMAPETHETQSIGVTHLAPNTDGTQSMDVTHMAPDTDGTQSMDVTHMAPDTDGTQSMGVTHMAPDTDGTQSMGVTHMAPDTDGTQSMGVTHMAPDTDGTQSMGVTHMAPDTDGTQSMGVTHMAPDTDGTQSMGVTHMAPDTDGTQSVSVTHLTPDAAETPPLPSTFSDDITSDPELEKIFSDEENVSKDSGLSETMPSPLQFQKYNETQKKPISSSSGESSSQTLNVHSKGIEEQQCAWAQSEHDVRLQLSKCQSVLREVSQVLSEIQGIDEDTMEQWRKGILDLQKESPLPKTHIAVVGETGAGKSSLLNALLEQEDLLPTSAMRACTAVVVEIEKSSVIGYKAEVEFLSKEEWEGELRALITDMKDKSGRFKKRPSDKPETQVAHSRVMAVYGKIAELDELKDDTTVTKYLGEKKQISENTASAFRSAIELYIDTNSEEPTQRNGGQIWPIVRCVRIFVPEADVLRTGAVLVDLPGTRDSNAARDRIAKEYLKKCDVVWVVTNITRAVDDKTAKEILTSNMRRQLLMDGHYESMAVICTKTDLYNTQEIKRALHLHDKTRNLEDNVVQLGHRLNTLEAERKTLYEQWEKGGTFAAESDPRNEILAKEKEIIHLKQQREESLRNINLICVSARNNYSKQRICQDFYQSRQELEKGEDEADGEEEDEEERDAESNVDEEPSEGKTLRVFTVSSKEFLEVRRSALEGSTRLFNSERDTEIPDLRDYTIETALKCSMLGAERVIRNTACIISQIITYLLNRKAQDESHQAEIKLTVEKCLDDLREQLTEAVSLCHEQMTFFIQEKIRGSLDKGVMCAKESCESIVRRWASRQSGGYSYPTYRATCVRQGYYSSPACGVIDFNEQLSQPITKEITKSWTEVFSGELVRCLSQFNQFVAKQLGAFFNNMKSLLVELGTGYETIVSIEKQQLKSTQAELLHFFVDQKEFISHRQRHISRLLNPEVQQRMIEVYNECQSVRGAGSFERMKDLMTSHVNKEKHKIFGEAAESLMKQLNFLQTNIRESLKNFVKVRHQSLRQQCEPLLQPMKKEEEILPDLQNIWSHVSHICQRSQVDFHLPELEITPKPKPCDQDTRTLNRVEPPEITCLSNVKHILNCNTIKEPNQDVNTDHLILNPGPSSSALPPSLLLCRKRSSVSPHRGGFEKKSHVIRNLTQQEPR
ncbi:hypothetical protein XELAEV_18034149mg [Xenopus laevis]|uniref:AAA+ ATPase domain-containing protein n=1 Tax=Xenopus laevis TaxID=8355 RepID=A0A974CKM1_XENLA|nr:hypothetical protein XELAEV_18034149mg [Xenopus laevis]